MTVSAVHAGPFKWASGDALLLCWLKQLRTLHGHFEDTLRAICDAEGSLHTFCFDHGLRRLGLQRVTHGWWYREWAPAALSCSLVGDFNSWDPNANPCTRGSDGVFVAFVPDSEAECSSLQPGGRYKASLLIRMVCGERARVLRVPAWARCTMQDPVSGEFSAVVPLEDPLEYRWQHPRPDPAAQPPLRVYEAHVGISSSEPVIATWRHFRLHVLPRVVRLGYTAVLLMAVQEHGLYESYGYQVTSFFAPSSRFGPPSELQALVDAIHASGLLVFFELVHAHASSNSSEGLSCFDGSDGGYFLRGGDGTHAEWGTRCFDFGQTEVLRFHLAQLCWFAEAYRVDGFRFDAVSTSLYRHRSLFGNGTFSGGYADFFGGQSTLDVAALTYFKLANLLTHSLVAPPLVTFAEEHSGLPGLCAPVHDGGVGFDYRLAMGVPPLWERLLSAPYPQRIDVGALVYTMCQRRDEERRLAYCENHDGSLVGGQALAFRLMGAEMFDGMSVLRAPSDSMVRGMALHKMARLLTYTLAGEAYLNFIGNEFGHAQWVDLPRKGNDYAFDMARRRWDLAEDSTLRYAQLLRFDMAMHRLHGVGMWLRETAPRQLGQGCECCEARELIWFTRGRHTWCGFNFQAREAATLLAVIVSEADGPTNGKACDSSLVAAAEREAGRYSAATAGGAGRRAKGKRRDVAGIRTLSLGGLKLHVVDTSELRFGGDGRGCAAFSLQQHKFRSEASTPIAICATRTAEQSVCSCASCGRQRSACPAELSAISRSTLRVHLPAQTACVVVLESNGLAFGPPVSSQRGGVPKAGSRTAATSEAIPVAKGLS